MGNNVIAEATSLLATMAFINMLNGYQLYHSTTEICCNGTVHRKHDSHSACCGSKPYLLQSGLMCCGNELVPSPKGNGVYDCCGQDDQGRPVMYDRMTQHCCDGAVIDRPECGTLWGCCGRALCEFSNGKCCGGKITPTIGTEICCGSQEIDSETEVCCFGTHQQDFEGYGVTKTSSDQNDCCDGVPYHTSTAICCNGHLVDRTSNETALQCCGYTLFDPLTEMCCGYKVFPLFATARCCWSAAQVYDYTAEACCHDFVVPVEEKGSQDMACCTIPSY